MASKFPSREVLNLAVLSFRLPPHPGLPTSAPGQVQGKHLVQKQCFLSQINQTNVLTWHLGCCVEINFPRRRCGLVHNL